LHLRRSQGLVEALPSGASVSGPALGLWEVGPYPIHLRSLEPGDGVVLFTDGLYDLRSATGEPWDQGSLATFVQSQPKTSLETLFDRLVEGSAETSLNDDVCLLGMEV
jgi:phosphoserine phosphatase RsbU/P